MQKSRNSFPSRGSPRPLRACKAEGGDCSHKEAQRPKNQQSLFEFFVPLCGIKDFRGKGIISVTSGFYTAARLSDQEDATLRQVSSNHHAFKGNNTIG